MWIAGLAVIAAIAATIRLTRSPELVWWTSPEIGKSGLHVKALVPRGWEVRSSIGAGLELGGKWPTYLISPVDRRPAFLRWLFRHQNEVVGLEVFVDSFRAGLPERHSTEVRTIRFGSQGRMHTATRYGTFDQARRIWVFVSYDRTDLRGFEATYKEVCGSLRIE